MLGWHPLADFQQVCCVQMDTTPNETPALQLCGRITACLLCAGSSDFTATWSGAHANAPQLKLALEKCLDDPACVLKEIPPGATWQGVYAKLLLL